MIEHYASAKFEANLSNRKEESRIISIVRGQPRAANSVAADIAGGAGAASEGF